jgi:hypothetical protein
VPVDWYRSSALAGLASDNSSSGSGVSGARHQRVCILARVSGSGKDLGGDCEQWNVASVGASSKRSEQLEAERRRRGN